MKRSKRTTLLCILLTVTILFLGCSSQLVEWPQWQGPTRDNISEDTALLEAWRTAVKRFCGESQMEKAIRRIHFRQRA